MDLFIYSLLMARHFPDIKLHNYKGRVTSKPPETLTNGQLYRLSLQSVTEQSYHCGPIALINRKAQLRKCPQDTPSIQQPNVAALTLAAKAVVDYAVNRVPQ
ncbi:hypothetical protein DPMN_012261 [Dreissena polymorpha]|uniref:Uncharacterized protein n=1 Tax=Dreissena polymorpha TaxID=45954 RepID=A0A9D4N339_DREPO|nr:hypothetical protein DPMN_012261 [Dreissena polymorpha]